jgi:hypothetical protein
MPLSLQKGASIPRQQFYKKYIVESNYYNSREKQGVLNMVYANKKEREAEKEVCKYIVTKVLN